MNDSSTGKSHALAWILSLLVALPLLYLLSVPAVAIFTVRGNAFLAPTWLDYYVEPAFWLCTETPLRKPFDVYAQWWDDMTPYEEIFGYPPPSP